MKIAEYKQMMEYLTRPGFNGGGSVRNETVLPKKKPEEEVKKRKIKNFEKAKPALENPKEVKEMIDKPKRGLVDESGSYAGKSAAERMREYRLKNPRPFKVTEIVADGVKYNIPNNAMKPESAKGFIKFLNKRIIAIEISDNDGFNDQHRPLSVRSKYLPFLNLFKKNLPIILEFRNAKLSDIKSSINLVKTYYEKK